MSKDLKINSNDIENDRYKKNKGLCKNNGEIRIAGNLGNINFYEINTTGSLFIGEDTFINCEKDIIVGGDIHSLSSIKSSGNIECKGDIRMEGRTNDITTDKNIHSLGSIITYGNIKSKERVVASGTIFGGSLDAKNGISAGKNISTIRTIRTENKNITAGDEIEVWTGNIKSGGSISSGKYIIASGSIEAKKEIIAQDIIQSGLWILCEYISSNSMIFAGLRNEACKDIECKKISKGKIGYGKFSKVI